MKKRTLALLLALAVTFSLAACGNKNEEEHQESVTTDKTIDNSSLSDPNDEWDQDIVAQQDESTQLVRVKGTSVYGSAQCDVRVPQYASIFDDGNNTSITWALDYVVGEVAPSIESQDPVLVDVNVSVTHFAFNDAGADYVATAGVGSDENARGDAETATAWNCSEDTRHGEGKTIYRLSACHAETLGDRWFLTANVNLKYNDPNSPATIPELTDEQLQDLYDWFVDCSTDVLSKIIVEDKSGTQTEANENFPSEAQGAQTQDVEQKDESYDEN